MQLSSSVLKPWAGPRLRHFPQDKTGPALGLPSLLEEAPTASKEQLPHCPVIPRLISIHSYLYFVHNSVVFVHNCVVFAGFKHSLRSPCADLPTATNPFLIQTFQLISVSHHLPPGCSIQTDSPCAGVKIPQAATGGYRKQLGRLQSEHGRAAARSGCPVTSRQPGLRGFQITEHKQTGKAGNCCLQGCILPGSPSVFSCVNTKLDTKREMQMSKEKARWIQHINQRQKLEAVCKPLLLQGLTAVNSILKPWRK